jgi:hypothetical protein
MGDQNLIRALQDLVARHSPTSDPRWVSSEIVSRDRLRVRLLAGLVAFLWLAGIAGVLYMIFWFNRFIILFGPFDGGHTNEWYATALFHAKMELHHSLEACLGAVPILLLAALGTVWLVLSSRRATLNQINISLAQISEQLRRSQTSPT